MTPTAEPSFMTTFIPVFLGGVVSALVTLLLGQPLQYYFWRRQRHAERQLAIIEGVNKLTAEVQFLLMSGEDISSHNESLSKVMSATIANVTALFSPQRAAAFDYLHPVIAKALRLPTESPREQRLILATELMYAHHMALIYLYKDMGIPPRRPALWMWEHAWLPITRRGTQAWKWMRGGAWPLLWGRVWDHPQQYWRMSCWPTLCRWGAQVRTRWWR